MTKSHDRKHLHDVAPTVEEDLFHDRTDRMPAPEVAQGADDLSPDQKVATNTRSRSSEGRPKGDHSTR